MLKKDIIEIFMKINQMAMIIGKENQILPPRICGRHTQRVNAKTPEEYWHLKSIGGLQSLIPFLVKF